MRKFIYFPLWDIERLENILEEMEKSGYRLTGVSYSHWFTFKESAPKQMSYFLTHWSKGGASMVCCDYALESDYDAKPIDTKMCCFSLYRTKEKKDELSLLYEVRMDYIRSKLLEYALASLSLTIIFTILFFFAVSGTIQCISDFITMVLPIAVCTGLTGYYFYGYIKQRSKCRKYESEREDSR